MKSTICRRVRPALLCLSALFLLALAGCSEDGPGPGLEGSHSAPAESGSLAPTPAPEPTPTPQPTPEPAPEPVLPSDLSLEPPLDEDVLSIAVPDFLTEEQQRLYRRAYTLYQHMFSGWTLAIDYIADDTGTLHFENNTWELIRLDDYGYCLAQNRYRDWALFDAVIHSVFTDDFWEERNYVSSIYDDGVMIPVYRNIDGRLGVVEMERGDGLAEYVPPDEFVLAEQTSHSISFVLVAHYADHYYESLEERNEWTLEFPIRMVLTEDGWRFDEFHTGLGDRSAPEYAPQFAPKYSNR